MEKKTTNLQCCCRCGKLFSPEDGYVFELIATKHGEPATLEKMQWCDKCYHLPDGVYHARVSIKLDWVTR